MFGHKTSMDEIWQPNAESYDAAFVQVKPRSNSTDNHKSAVSLEFPVSVSGGKYIDLSRSYFEFDLSVGIVKKSTANQTDALVFAPIADSPTEFGNDSQVGLDRAWWANTLSGVRHRINGHTICSSNDVVLTEIASMQTHSSDYNEKQGSSFSYQLDDLQRKKVLTGGTSYRTGMRPLQSMNIDTLIPASVGQTFELDFKSFEEYNQAIFKITGTPSQLQTNGVVTTTQTDAAFRHHSELADYLAAANVVTSSGSGVRTGTAADRVFFSINDVTLVLATVSDKANRALPSSMLLEWEDQDINRISVGSTSINSQLDIQHGHKVSIFTRLDTSKNNVLINSVSAGQQNTMKTTEASILIGGTQYPSPALRLFNYIDEDSFRAYLLYNDANHGYAQSTQGGEKSFTEWALKPVFSQKISIPAEVGRQKLGATLRMQYGDVKNRTCTVASTYIKACLLNFSGGEVRAVTLSTV